MDGGAAPERAIWALVQSLPGPDVLRKDFNERRADPRVLSLVSPTCDQCLAGLRVVVDTIGDARGITVLVLWLDMIAGDGPEAAARMSSELARNSGVKHYWEGDGWPVSSRVRSLLGIGAYDPKQSAWDVHVLYGQGIEWSGVAPPSPTAVAYNTLDDMSVGKRLSATVIRRWLG